MHHSFKNAKKYFVTATQPTTIHALLSTHLKNTIAADLTLEAGGVWFGKKLVKDPHLLLQPGDTLRVYRSWIQTWSYLFLPQHIVFETADFMVVYKPAGVTTTSDRSSGTANLTYGIAQYYRRLGITYNPSPINRIDFMVSGLVLYPKHKKAELHLFRLSQSRKIMKSYRVYCLPIDHPPSYLRVNAPISFLNKAAIDATGKPSETLFIFNHQTDAYICYSAILLTGRRHQIRLHAAQFLSPILGDDLYGQKTSTFSNGQQGMGLISYGLNFTYNGQRYRIRLSDRLSATAEAKSGERPS